MTEPATAPYRLEIAKGEERSLAVGGLRIEACRREVGEIDGGITVNVFRETTGEGEALELLRLDLFRKRPHYHAPAENAAETVIEASDLGAIAWGIEQLAHRMPDRVAEAGHAQLSLALDTAALAAAEDALRALFADLPEPTEVQTFEVPAEVAARLRGAPETG